jgi:hypothetical protein
MFNNLHRIIAVGSVATVIAAVGALGAASAVADPGDPVTGGSATLAVSPSANARLAHYGVYAALTAPGAVVYDDVNNAIDFNQPVIGGDASTFTLFGTLELGGNLYFADAKTHTSIEFSDLTFDIAADTITGTSSVDASQVVLFDAVGNHDYSTADPETYSSSTVKYDPAGAKYLKTALHSKAFVSHGVVGSFSASWENTNDGDV